MVEKVVENKVNNQGYDGMAITGFVLSLVSLFIAPVSILGLIFSIIGLRRTKRENKMGQGLAIAGIIISLIILLLLVVGIVWIIISATNYATTPEASYYNINNIFLSLIK